MDATDITDIHVRKCCSFPVTTHSKCSVWFISMLHFQRISLDKLLQRIHKFYVKISDGANLSVNIGEDLNSHPGLNNVMNSFDCK